ncbi:hypothetical protein JCM8547_006664 [Rhodosporidiobolus lusitaniae]
MSTDAAAAAAAQQAALLAALQKVINQVVASFFSCALCGVVLSLVVTYSTRFPNDRWQYKLLVYTLTVLAIVDTAITASWAYSYAVTNFAEPIMLAKWPWQFTGYATGPSVLVAQLFFVWRVWVVSGRKAYALVSLTTCITVAAVVCCFYLGVWSTQVTMLTQFTEKTGWAWSWLGCELAADFFITAGMVYYVLLKPRREIGGSSHMQSSPLMRIVIHAFTTNFASAVLQLAVVITIGFSIKVGALYYTVPGFMESKMYIASVLAVLNARRQTDDATAHSSDYNHNLSRSKGLGARPTTNLRSMQANSVHVHVEHQVEEERGEVYGGAGQGFSPYAVTFSSSGGGRGGEKADETSVEEKGERGGY